MDTITILGREKGIIPGVDVTLKLKEFFKDCQNLDGNKKLILEEGEYFINSDNCERATYYITNTMGDEEWRENEKPHEYKIAMLLKGIKNLEISGQGAIFVLHGQMTNMVIDDCENITIEGVQIKTIKPNLHKLTVIKKGLFFADYFIDERSEYVKTQNGEEKDKYFFVGKDYKYSFTVDASRCWWMGRVDKCSPNTITRTFHPFVISYSIKEIKPRVFRVRYLKPAPFKKGTEIYFFETRRNNVGIFINRSKNIVFDEIEQNFNYSLAFVVQNTENFTLVRSRLAPEKDSNFKFCSLADFIQVCMCKGDIVIKENYFEGAGDDVINVHGVHFIITKIEGNKMVVSFKHAQSHGYNALNVGDDIEYICPYSLVTKGKAKILESKLVNEYDIEIEVDRIEGAKLGLAIEDITMCPNLYFTHNYMDRIITRGMLITTRGKVIVENNVFNDTTMHSILISNDAKNWYESGRVTDVTIRKNIFYRSGEKNIFIKPENAIHKDFIHSNILIEGNEFKSYPKGGIYLKSTKDVTIKNNKIDGKTKGFITCKNSQNIDSDI